MLELAAATRIALVEPDRGGGLEQAVGADDIGFDKGVGAGDGAVDVALGGEMDDGVDEMAAQQLLGQRLVANVAMHEMEVAGAFKSGEIVALAGISERIEHDDGVSRMLTPPVMGEIRTNEAGSSGNQQ